MKRFWALLILLTLPTWLWAEPDFRYPAADRIVAVGDLHGDLSKTRAVLRLIGAIDDTDAWIGGNLVLVQTGDQLDRGDEERAILALLDRLQDEATAAGGAVHLLNGNHELMNARPDLRYVTEGGFADFADLAPAENDSLLLAYPPEQRGRVAAFRPGGPYALMLAERNSAVIIGDNLFVHGGVRPDHVAFGLERLNREIRTWLRGEGPCPPGVHKGGSVTWTRDYSDDPDAADCAQLADVLARLGVKRMIVGHTVQEGGLGSRCEAQVWCVDAGIAEYYGGHLQALEIRGDTLTVLK